MSFFVGFFFFLIVQLASVAFLFEALCRCPFAAVCGASGALWPPLLCIVGEFSPLQFLFAGVSD